MGVGSDLLRRGEGKGNEVVSPNTKVPNLEHGGDAPASFISIITSGFATIALPRPEFEAIGG